MLSVTGPLSPKVGLAEVEIELIADSLFATTEYGEPTLIYRIGSVIPVAQLPGPPGLLTGKRILCAPGHLFDSRTWQRLLPEKGRRFHAELAKLAPDGRFLLMPNNRGRITFIDTATEKAFQLAAVAPYLHQPKLGWVEYAGLGYGARLHRLPPLDHLEITSDLLELWAQVAVRGQLDDEGAFVKWDESTWEKKRQELAAKPAPYPDFPFPGHVAVDRLHWLREEYLAASDADKPGLAKQLLDRALAAGDKAEAIRWRAIVNPKAPSTPVLPQSRR